MPLRRVLNSIITRLLILVISLAVLGAVARYYALGHFLRQDMSTVVEEQQLSLTSYIARDIDDKLTQRQTLISRMASEWTWKKLPPPAQLQQWLSQQYHYQTLFSGGLFITDTHGQVIADFPVMPGRMGNNYRQHDYIRASLQGRSLIGSPTLDPGLIMPTLPVSTPLLNHDMQQVGVLVGMTTLAAPGFLDLLQKTRIGLGQAGFWLVSPRDNLFVAATQSEMRLQPLPPRGSHPMLDRALDGYRGSGISHNAQGEEEVVSAASVASTGWFVMARLPASTAFATVAHVQGFATWTACLSVLAFILLAGTGMVLILRPLSHAASTAQAMTHNTLPLAPLPVPRNDEVGNLLTAFNGLLRKLHVQQAELERLAHHDSLTGLPNRLLLTDRLRLALAQAKRHGSQLAILFMDLDGFKSINDQAGHEAGNDALYILAQRLQSCIRETDTLARIGGDEFVLLMCNLDEHALEACQTVADKCIATIHQPLRLNGGTFQLGISIGLVLAKASSTVDSLLQEADQAMYLAKHAGGNCLIRN
ncbi:MAG: GGDEF domain-containing protein [Aquitalea sp.]|nr:GGDEF domain-containing protein [Aquitalea sp.]